MYSIFEAKTRCKENRGRGGEAADEVILCFNLYSQETKNNMTFDYQKIETNIVQLNQENRKWWFTKHGRNSDFNSFKILFSRKHKPLKVNLLVYYKLNHLNVTEKLEYVVTGGIKHILFFLIFTLLVQDKVQRKLLKSSTFCTDPVTVSGIGLTLEGWFW